MNNLTKKLGEVYNPFGAIIAYKSNVDTSYYLEFRKIKNGEFQSAKPLTQNEIGNLLENVRRSSKQIVRGLHGKIPSNLLYCSTDVVNVKLVWYRPPEKRRLFFKQSLDMPNGEIYVPGMIYYVYDKSLFVYAYKGKKPESNTLYRAPFMNVYEDCRICLGDAKVHKPDEMTFEKVIDYWEKMFWLSEFSHLIGTNPVKGNLTTITKELMATGKPFPTNVLKKTQMTLKKLIGE